MSSIQKVVLPSNKEMQHARIVELRAQFGDWVDKGQEVMRLQINNRTLAFTSPQAGILTSTAPVGHQPEPGSLLFSLKPQDEVSHYKTKKVTLTNSKEMRHGRIVELRVQAGDSVKKDQDILVLQIHDRTLVFTSPQAGIVESIASMGHQPEPGSLLFSLILSEEQGNLKKPEPTNENISNKNTTPHPPTRKEPTDIKKPNASNAETSSAGIVILAVGIAGLLGWLYWPNQNVIVMDCKVSEYLKIHYDLQGKVNEHSYYDLSKDYAFLKDRKYEIYTGSTGSPSLRLLGISNDYLLCDNAAVNCDSISTVLGARFTKTFDDTSTDPLLGAPPLSYEFNYVDKTLYAIVPINISGSTTQKYGANHILYRCTDNALKDI